MYAPENPARTDGAREFAEELRQADGIIVASPGYHGSVSGLVKNALDYVEDLRDDERSYFDGLAGRLHRDRRRLAGDRRHPAAAAHDRARAARLAHAPGRRDQLHETASSATTATSSTRRPRFQLDDRRPRGPAVRPHEARTAVWPDGARLSSRTGVLKT